MRPTFVLKYLALAAGYAGLCLGYTRRVLGAPAKYATALKAWQGTRLRGPHGVEPPAGVPVFFAPTRNGFGHVAPSIGGGRVRSTHSATGKISNATIASIARVQALLGWSYDLNGRFVGPELTVTIRRGTSGEPTRLLQARLSWAGYPLTLDGVAGAKTDAAIRRYQREHGLAADGVVGPKTRKKVNTIR